MSKKNINLFIKNLSLHISNINRQFCNIKSEILVDYIRAELLGITVVTNKVSQLSDLILIDQNSNNVNTLQVDEPQLPKSKSYLKIIGILKNVSLQTTSKQFSNKIKSSTTFCQYPNLELSRCHPNLTCPSCGSTYGTSKAEAIPRCSSIDASTSVNTQQLSEE